ncbi:MAG: antibiotic biosynthesis monooxygenase [Actinobacteria bacterium]|nr:antibiotic biosynthesis monooxygenase [Actinomycetota bacterium]
MRSLVTAGRAAGAATPPFPPLAPSPASARSRSAAGSCATSASGSDSKISRHAGSTDSGAVRYCTKSSWTNPAVRSSRREKGIRNEHSYWRFSWIRREERSRGRARARRRAAGGAACRVPRGAADVGALPARCAGSARRARSRRRALNRRQRLYAPGAYVSTSRLRVGPGRADELVAAFRRRAHLVDTADGFLDLQVWQSDRDPEEVLMVSRWRDRESFRTYMRSEAHEISHARIDPTLQDAITLERLEHLHTYEVVAD